MTLTAICSVNQSDGLFIYESAQSINMSIPALAFLSESFCSPLRDADSEDHFTPRRVFVGLLVEKGGYLSNDETAEDI